MVWRTLLQLCDDMVAVRGEGRGSFSLLAHRQGTRESKGFGEMFSDVFAMYFTTHFMRRNKLGFWM